MYVWASTTLLCNCSSGSTSVKGVFGLKPPGVVPDSNAVEYELANSLHAAYFLAAEAHCQDALPDRHLSLPHSRNFTLFPQVPRQRPVSPSVCRCGAPSSTATLPCTLLNPLLHLQTPLSSSCRGILSSDRSVPRNQPSYRHSIRAVLLNYSMREDSHRVTHGCLVSSASTEERTWTPSPSLRISDSLMLTSSTVATSALAQLAPTHMSPPPPALAVVTSRACHELQSTEREPLMLA
jgi:hypothetical protein